MPGEERAGEPVLKCLANDLAELAFDGGHGGIRELGRESFLHPVGESRFAAARGDRNDAVAVGPVGSWLTRLDLLRPLMAQKVEDHDGNAILHQPLLFGQGPPALFFKALLDQPVDGDRVDLQLARQLLDERLGRDRDPRPDGNGILGIFLVQFRG